MHNRLPGYCQETCGAVAPLAAAVSSLEIDTARLHASAGRDWSTASALADDLVSTHGLSYREAHDTVAQLIATYEATQDLRLVSQSSFTSGGLEGYSTARITQILDHMAFVETRTSAGGTARGERNKLAEMAVGHLDDISRDVKGRRRSVDLARHRLIRDATNLIKS